MQNFTRGVDFPTILSESRKYALSLTLGTQTLSQLPDESIAAGFGNCATIISFRVSGDDAQALVREFAASGEGPRMADDMYNIIAPASRLQNFPQYKLYVKTLLHGQPQEPYRLVCAGVHARSENSATADTLSAKPRSRAASISAALLFRRILSGASLAGLFQRSGKGKPSKSIAWLPKMPAGLKCSC